MTTHYLMEVLNRRILLFVNKIVRQRLPTLRPSSNRPTKTEPERTLYCPFDSRSGARDFPDVRGQRDVTITVIRPRGTTHPERFPDGYSTENDSTFDIGKMCIRVFAVQ